MHGAEDSRQLLAGTGSFSWRKEGRDMSIQESKGNHYTWRRCLASMTSSDRADPSAPPSWARAAPAKETGSNTSPAGALKTFCLAWGRACGLRAGCYLLVLSAVGCCAHDRRQAPVGGWTRTTTGRDGSCCRLSPLPAGLG